MFTLTYDLWNSIIEEVIDAYAPSFEAMQNMADSIQLSRSLVEELKLKGAKELAGDNRQFLLTIEPYDDEIGGFKILLVMAESVDAFEKIVADAIASQGFSWEDIVNFEAEHGLNLADEILNRIEEEHEVYAENSDVDLVFELAIFDSEDIDNNSRIGNGAWN
jgi:cupin superfamily acireductone dioxygenase involved in methionine salvage